MTLVPDHGLDHAREHLPAGWEATREHSMIVAVRARDGAKVCASSGQVVVSLAGCMESDEMGAAWKAGHAGEVVDG